MKSRKVTPKATSLEEVLNVLANGRFSELIGTIESDVLDFKGAPYRLESTKEKLELAKDVSGLANAGGGVLVMGIGTSVLEGYPHEVADDIRSFTAAMLDVKQYEDVIANWIYPGLNLEIKWVPSSEDAEKGVAYIRISESEVGRKPFLTVAVLQEDNKKLGNVVGFFQRKGDKVIHWSAEELHHAFRDGRRFDEHLSEIGETLGKILSQRKTARPRGVAPDIVNKRIESAIEAVGLTDSISYVLVSYPDTDVEISGLFESRTSDVVKLIDEPPQLRYAGFDISTHERTRIVNGEFRRSVLKAYKLLEVWRDGMIVFVTDGGEGFLCWGDYRRRDFLRINTIGLVESVYLFSLFVRKVYELGGVPDSQVQMGLQIRNIPEDRKYGLPKSTPGGVRWYANVDLAYTESNEILAEKKAHWAQVPAEALAYGTLCDFYARFGVEHEWIPYVKEQDGEKVIDVDKIKNIS